MNHHQKQIKKVHASTLIENAWAKSVTLDNAVNGFKATGIFLLNETDSRAFL